MAIVLVTGGSGFVASHCIVKLLNSGYHVRTTVRSTEMVEYVKSMVVDFGDIRKLSFVVADLNDDHGWASATHGCKYVLHVASPVPEEQPKDESILIKPAVDGTLRVLQAAHDSGTVKRVVITSCTSAIGYGHKGSDGASYTEADWTDPTSPKVSPYHRSKTLAEQAAWKFADDLDTTMSISVVNAGTVFGPPLGSRYSSSVKMARQIVEGKMKLYPKVWISAVDARDLAELEVMLMSSRSARNERFIAVAGDPIYCGELMKKVKDAVDRRLYTIPTSSMPKLWYRFSSNLFGGSVDAMIQEGKQRFYSNKKAKSILGWTPRSAVDSFIDMLEVVFEQTPIENRYMANNFLASY